jgi:hypothetical protein
VVLMNKTENKQQAWFNQENITILTVVHSLELLQYLADFAFKINPNHMT